MESQYGAYSPSSKYLAALEERWKAVPSSTGNLNLTCCGRISMLRNFAGIDIVAMYPAAKSAPQAGRGWNDDAFLQAVEACHKAGYPFGLGIGQTFDSVNNTGIIYSAFGAQRVDANGEITVDSPAVHAVPDYARKLGRFFPPDAASYDNASNDRALISGKSALIMNPPSAWAVAKRDAPKIAEDCWHFPCPIGPEGRYIPYNYCLYGAWSFGTNLACTVSGCIDGAVPGTNPIPADAGLPPVLCP